MSFFLKKHFDGVSSISNFFWFVYCLLYDFGNLCFSNLDKKRKNIKNKENTIYQIYGVFKLKQYFYKNIQNNEFLFSDLL